MARRTPVSIASSGIWRQILRPVVITVAAVVAVEEAAVVVVAVAAEAERMQPLSREPTSSHCQPEAKRSRSR